MDTIKDTIIFRIIFVIELFIIKLDHKIKYTSRQKKWVTHFFATIKHNLLRAISPIRTNVKRSLPIGI